MIDIVYFAWNRREFTQVSFETVLENTNWDLVSRLIVYDDGSRDGTDRYLAGALGRITAIPTEFRRDGGFGTSVGAFDHYLHHNPAQMFATIENDLAVPPGWLEDLLGVMERNPELELLGLECSWNGPPGPAWDTVYVPTRHSHIGGNGLMRYSAFAGRTPFPVLNYTGFEVWQGIHRPTIGWISPDLRCCLLDRIPVEPWASISAYYVEHGWQRPWKPLGDSWYWEWLPQPELPKGLTGWEPRQSKAARGARRWVKRGMAAP